MSEKKQSKYSPQQIDQAMEIYQVLGLAETTRLTGVGKGAIEYHATRRNLVQPSKKQIALLKEASRERSEGLRLLVGEKLMQRCNELLDRMTQPQSMFLGSKGVELVYPVPPPQDIKALAQSVSALMGEYRIEIGEQTGHIEQVGPSVSVVIDIGKIEDARSRRMAIQNLADDPDVIEGKAEEDGDE